MHMNGSMAKICDGSIEYTLRPTMRATRKVRVMGCKKKISDGANAAPMGNEMAAV